MTRHDRPAEPEEEFAAWLDTLVDGKELPLAPRDGETEWIEATARHTYQLASEARLTAGERRRIEEEIMASAHQPSARFTLGRLPNCIGRVAHRASAGLASTRPDHSPLSSQSRLMSIMSGALVAIMLLAIVAGYGVHNGWGPWHRDNQPTRIAAPAVVTNAANVPNPQDCTAQPLSDAEMQKIVSGPFEQRTYQLANAKSQTPVDVVEGVAILQVYEQIRDCAVSPVSENAGSSLMSPHAIQEMYWRAVAVMGIYDTRSAEPGAAIAATPSQSVPTGYNAYDTPVSYSAFVWQPNISKTDTYFAQINVGTMDTLKDGRVVAFINWSNLEGQPPHPNALPPLTGLIFIKINGQWELDDWLFGTQILTESGR